MKNSSMIMKVKILTCRNKISKEMKISSLIYKNTSKVTIYSQTNILLSNEKLNKYVISYTQQLEEINRIMEQNQAIITPALDQITVLPEQIKKEDKKKVANVKLPEIKKKKEQVELYNPKTKDKNYEAK